MPSIKYLFRKNTIELLKFLKIQFLWTLNVNVSFDYAETRYFVVILKIKGKLVHK